MISLSIPRRPRQKDGHDEARGLPDRGDHDGVDRHLAVLDPVELEAGPAPSLQRLFEPDARIEEPFPSRAGDDEAERHGVEVERPQHPFGADFLVQEDSEGEADRRADGDVQPPEDHQVLDGRRPVAQPEQLLVVLEADQVVLRKNSRVGERQVNGKDDKAVNEEDDRREARCEHQPGQRLLYPAAKVTAMIHHVGHTRTPRCFGTTTDRPRRDGRSRSACNTTSPLRRRSPAPRRRSRNRTRR